MLNEQWHKWKPLQELSYKYHLDTIINDPNNFRIILKKANSPQAKVDLDFTHSAVYVTQKTCLSLRTKTINRLKNVYGSTFIKEWSFFKITNSQEKQRIINQADNLYTFDTIQHYVIITIDFYIDIVAYTDPIATMIMDKCI